MVRLKAAFNGAKKSDYQIACSAKVAVFYLNLSRPAIIRLLPCTDNPEKPCPGWVP